MSRARSERTLIRDRFNRCKNALDENIRRFEEIAGFYADGEDQNPGHYAKHIAGIDALRQGHIDMRKFLDEYQRIMGV